MALTMRCQQGLKTGGASRPQRTQLVTHKFSGTLPLKNARKSWDDRE